MEYDEAHLKEGRGILRSEEGCRSLYGGSGICTESVVASRASRGSDEGVFLKSYIQGEGDFSVFKEGYAWVGLGSYTRHDGYWKTVLTSPGKYKKICTRKDKISWRKAAEYLIFHDALLGSAILGSFSIV